MAKRNEPEGKRRRTAVKAQFTLSWDGRVIDGGKLEKGFKELCVVWRPCVLGGRSAATITGLDQDFLPRGLVLDLVRLERTGDQCVARYRVRADRS